MAENVSWATTEAVRRSMQSNRSRDTAPELAVRRLLHAHGLRYRVAVRPLPAVRCTADIVFRPVMLAVFIDGCFWHGCPQHYREPASNVEYWVEKVSRNRQRDAEIVAALDEAGWSALRFWEHEQPVTIAETVAREVVARRADRTSDEAAVRSPQPMLGDRALRIDV